MDWRRWASIARLNPENCRLNGDRKLLTQKIMRVDEVARFRPTYFLHEVQFFAGIGPAHFPAETTRPLGPRLSAIFSSLFQCLLLYLAFVFDLSKWSLQRYYIIVNYPNK